MVHRNLLPGTAGDISLLFPQGGAFRRKKFMDAASSWLNELKLRASYGSLGNNATTSYYMYQSLFATANYVLNGNIAGGLAQTVLANPNLTCGKRPI